MTATEEIGRAYHTVLPLGADLVVARRDVTLGIFSGEDRVHLDLEGRLHRAWLGGSSYQRGLDGRVRRVHVGREPDASRWLDIDVLDATRATPVIDRTRAIVESAVRAARQVAAIPDAIAEPLARAAAWDGARYAAELQRFAAVYRPIPILPPDQNRALVVQVTEGCSFNRCTFCHLYRDVRFRLRPPEELRHHVRSVLELCGRALPLRHGVFLGQANALVVEQAKLLEAIRVVKGELDAPGRWPLGAFVDSFTRPKTAEELVELRELGLESVALGLESGSGAVLQGLGKPLEVAAAIDLVHALGDANIRRGVIVLVGAGGAGLAAEHVASTVDAIARMHLGRRDRVYLSPLHVHPGSAYEACMRADGLAALDGAALALQAESLRDGLRARGVTSPIALYDIRRFIY